MRLAADLAAAAEWQVREAARNPSTPAAALERLARDMERVVRWVAATNPSTLLESLLNWPDGDDIQGRET
ncbi:hypothetical protein [Azospirillum sp. B4]|uniref:hypothetical protein n=1 Tax=Azospirillum sp. B4 TaxID=95605 RepID=UPI00034B208E|nr:hypothetical protein [Azospirillum sp. B4]